MKPETASRFQAGSTKFPQQYYGKLLFVINNKIDEHAEHAQPVRTQQNFYPNQDHYDKRPESEGMGK